MKYLLAVLAVATLLSGCSGPPSEGDARKVIEDKIKKQAEGRIHLLSFSKSDGQKIESSGVQLYALAFTAELEFSEDCYWGPFSWGKWSGDFFTIAGKPNALDAFSPAYAGKVEATKGSRTKVEGILNFMKTEKGWNLIEQ